jgi:hypothetical protein
MDSENLIAEREQTGGPGRPVRASRSPAQQREPEETAFLQRRPIHACPRPDFKQSRTCVPGSDSNWLDLHPIHTGTHTRL